MANSIIENHQAKVFISTALQIARDIKNSWSKDSQISEEKVIKFYTDKDLLIIDEIGVQFGSEAEKIILFEIINTCYEQMKPTILISNLSEQELGDYIGERVLDRMMEGQGAIIAFDWESYRK
ncbi:ATP-binding protein [Mergibacter septicus]|uniref:ATP-binding protein n=1 Tax=Mergibacter septicus TaxID=221402 RepID=UPI002811A170|nr:ATP-binding protein [Mergibacter septicus]WMR96878.1 ATP-binding protein [Mergibacter septicus]